MVGVHDASTGNVSVLASVSVNVGEPIGRVLAQLRHDHGVEHLYYPADSVQPLDPGALWASCHLRPVDNVLAARVQLDGRPWQSFDDFRQRFWVPLLALQASSRWGGVANKPYYKDTTRAIVDITRATVSLRDVYETLRPHDAELCRFISGGVQRNPTMVLGDPRKGKSLASLNLALMALFRGLNVLLGVGPNKRLPAREWLAKLVEHGCFERFGVQGTDRDSRYSTTGARIFIYSHATLNDISAAHDFVSESMRKGRKVRLSHHPARRAHAHLGSHSSCHPPCARSCT